MQNWFKNNTRFILIFILLCFNINSVFSQRAEYKWINQLTTRGRDIYSVADAQGNIILAGNHETDLVIGSKTFSGPRSSFACLFIAKYNSSGDLIWVYTDSVRRIFDLSIDKTGNIYFTSITNQQLEVFCLQPDKKLKWKFTSVITSYYNDYINEARISCTDPNAVFISGIYQAEITLGTFKLKTKYAYDEGMFYARLDSMGNLVWADHVINNSYGYGIHVNDLKSDNFGNAYLCGDVGNNYIFRNCTYAPLSDQNAFVFKISADNPGIALKTLSSGYYDACPKIILDDTGNIYAATHFGGDVYLLGKNYHSITDNNYDNNLIIKLTPQLKPVWATSLQVKNLNYSDGFDFCRDKNGNFYVSGYYGDYPSYHQKLSKLLPNGSPLWQREFAKSNQQGNYFQVANLVMNAEEKLFVSGAFENIMFFGKQHYLTNPDNRPIILAEIDTAKVNNIISVWTATMVRVFPTVSDGIFHLETDSVQMKDAICRVYNRIGENIKELKITENYTTFNIKDLHPDLYYFTVEYKGKLYTYPIIKN